MLLFEKVKACSLRLFEFHGAIFVNLFDLSVFLVQKGSFFLSELSEILRDNFVVLLGFVVIKLDSVAADSV